MNKIDSTNIIKGVIRLKKGEWFYITSADFYPKEAINEILYWHSNNEAIAQINQISGLIHAKEIGTTTVYATVQEQSLVRVSCVIIIDEDEKATSTVFNENSVSNGATTNSSIAVASASSGNISTLGYSGKLFSYSNLGNDIVRLEKGMLSKRGSSNWISLNFKIALKDMCDIYQSMSADQRSCWLVMRLCNWISWFPTIASGDLDEIGLGILEDYLSGFGLNLGAKLGATVLGLYQWYLAEERAVNYFGQF